MKLTSAFCATAAMVSLSGCAYDTPPWTVAVATPAPTVALATPAPAVAIASPVPTVAVATPAPAVVATTSIPSSAVFYDQFYGTIFSGFWGSDGLYRYQLIANGPWLIDAGRHFRHEADTGFAIVNIVAPASGAILATALPAATVFYDSFYGPVYSGFWGTDHIFHYQLVARGPWLIDTAGHFRHEADTGFAIVNIAPPASIVSVATPAGGAILATAPPAATVFYDRFYGPVYSGFWGTDDAFHYQLVRSGPWLIDRDGHFRHDPATGFAVVAITPVTIPPG